MKKILFLFAIVALLGACCNNNNTGNNDATAVEKKCESISVDSFLVIAPDFVGKELTVKGTVDHVCKHGGKRVNIFTDDPNVTIHGNASESIGAFDAEIEGSEICMTGIVIETKIDMAYVEEWEDKIKKEMTKEEDDSEAEHAASVDHHAKSDEIQAYREQIEASENGYIAFYNLKVAKYHECDTKGDSDSKKLEDHDHDHDSNHGHN